MEERVITVSATASEKFPADTVRISLSAVGEAKKYAEAVEKADALADATVAALKKAGLDDVRARGIIVSTLRADRKITGYRATRSFEVEFAFEKKRMGAALDALADNACEWRVSFRLKDKSKASELLTRAVKSARESAETIAEAAGVKLGELSKAEYASSGAHECRPMLFRAANVAMDCGAANDVEPEEISLTESVTCSWSIVK